MTVDIFHVVDSFSSKLRFKSPQVRLWKPTLSYCYPIGWKNVKRDSRAVVYYTAEDLCIGKLSENCERESSTVRL